MRTLRVTAAAVAMLLASGTSLRADVTAPVTTSPLAAPASVDWHGPYAGLVGGFGPGLVTGGFHLGYNVVAGRLVAGIEARMAVGLDQGELRFGIPTAVRLGATIGEERRVLLYGTAGFGIRGEFWTAGLGVGAARSERLSLFAEAVVHRVFVLGCCGFSVQFGLNWHPLGRDRVRP